MKSFSIRFAKSRVAPEKPDNLTDLTWFSI